MIELNDETKWILGQLCFQCAGTAQILRLDGHEIKTKAEDEQAAVIHWMLCLYEEHGDQWREKASEILKDIVERNKTDGNNT